MRHTKLFYTRKTGTVQCKVLLLQHIKDKKQPVLQTINLGEQLLKIDFATREDIPKPASDDLKYLNFYKHQTLRFSQTTWGEILHKTCRRGWILFTQQYIFANYATKKLNDVTSKLLKLHAS